MTCRSAAGCNLPAPIWAGNCAMKEVKVDACLRWSYVAPASFSLFVDWKSKVQSLNRWWLCLTTCAAVLGAAQFKQAGSGRRLHEAHAMGNGSACKPCRVLAFRPLPCCASTRALAFLVSCHESYSARGLARHGYALLNEILLLPGSQRLHHQAEQASGHTTRSPMTHGTSDE